jgi:hypothetical protein
MTHLAQRSIIDCMMLILYLGFFTASCHFPILPLLSFLSHTVSPSTVLYRYLYPKYPCMLHTMGVVLQANNITIKQKQPQQQLWDL